MEHSVKIVRVYDSEKRLPNEYRDLVDRLWPRGFAKGGVEPTPIHRTPKISQD